MIKSELYERIVAAKLFIDDNYHEGIDLSSISRHVFISPFHFHRLFRKVYKRTPHQYITLRRLEKAKSLLAENRMVSDVCTQVGFESLGSFSILFKKEIGFTPQYYRNMAWKKKQEMKEEPRRAIPHCFLEQYYERS